MWRFLNIIIFLVLLIFASCRFNLLLQDDQEQYSNYFNCNTTEPKVAFLKVKFTRSPNQRNPLIFLFSGRFEEHLILDTLATDTVPSYRDYILISVEVEHFYTVMARYIRGDDTIYAIDGNYISKSFYYFCDTICWEVNGNKLNIKLKN